ncbi:hypothetical protein NSP_43210 [Nodularia spumigena CCY9414]|nr:hypothetical protein NSP_43210 [Nodularia spumigena CCY9414]
MFTAVWLKKIIRLQEKIAIAKRFVEIAILRDTLKIGIL